MNIEHHLMMENESEEQKINKCFLIEWSTYQAHPVRRDVQTRFEHAQESP